MKELDQDKFRVKHLNSELEKAQQTLKNIEYENQKLKDRLDDRNEEIKELTNEKYQIVSLFELIVKLFGFIYESNFVYNSLDSRTP